jgi:hypothetical protein
MVYNSLAKTNNSNRVKMIKKSKCEQGGLIWQLYKKYPNVFGR